MRIALIAPGIPDYCCRFAELAAGVGEVLVCASARQFGEVAPAAHGRIAFELLDWPRQSEVASTISFLWHLAKRIERWKPDVIHILVEDYVWMLMLSFLLRRSPIVTTVHDVVLHPGDRSSAKAPRFLVRLLARQSTAVVVHGNTLASDAERHLGIARRQIFVFPHPPLTDYANIAAHGGVSSPVKDAFNILFFGRIYKYKGLEYLLRAAPDIKRTVPNARFIVAGRGDDLAVYDNLVPRFEWFSIQNRYIPRLEAAALFANADLVVLPYVEASQSGILMIAIAFGLPVVATDTGEIAETVRSNEIGLIVPPRDAGALARAITTLAHDAEMRMRFSANAKRALAGPLSGALLAERLRNIYSNVLQNGR